MSKPASSSTRGRGFHWKLLSFQHPTPICCPLSNLAPFKFKLFQANTSALGKELWKSLACHRCPRLIRQQLPVPAAPLPGPGAEHLSPSSQADSLGGCFAELLGGDPSLLFSLWRATARLRCLCWGRMRLLDGEDQGAGDRPWFHQRDPQAPWTLPRQPLPTGALS